MKSSASPSHRVCAVSVDVDSLACYYRIHGITPQDGEFRDVVIRRGLRRFLDFFRERGIRATLFLVGEDFDAGKQGDHVRLACDLAAEAVAAGHEIANHSYRHPYELARLSPTTVHAEIALADGVLRRLAGQPIVGFRAPGYDLSAAMVKSLIELGYGYDSSIFTAAPYYVAKLAVMATMTLRGQQSGAVVANPLALLASSEPYRPDPQAPWRPGDAPLWELPIAVTPHLRLPVIGTSLLLAPAPLRDLLIRRMAKRSFFNFELHGIDLVDAREDDIPSEIVRKQPDLRLPVREKIDRLHAIFDTIERQFSFQRLCEVAASRNAEA